MTFKQQYDHPLWQKKRLEIFQRDNWKCLHCGSANKQLQVHHLSYVWNKKVWDYDNSNFETLCCDCHETETKRIKLSKAMAKYANNKKYPESLKKQFEEKKANALVFLADPHNNIWTWAKIHLEMEVKAFDINAVAKYFSNVLKRAEKAGYTDADVLAQVFASGIDIDAITLAMKQLSVKETQVMTMDAEVIVSEGESALY